MVGGDSHVVQQPRAYNDVAIPVAQSVGVHMLKTWLSIGVAWGLCFAAQAAEITLLETPVKVTATVNARAEGGFGAQLGVHNGPIAQLVSTVLNVPTQQDAERVLRQQVLWRAPYLFVHSSCGGGRTLRCEGETVFKVNEGAAVRMGDVIGTAPAIYGNGHFMDVYDKLEGSLDLAPELIPRFNIVLDDAGRQFAVNATATWSANAEAARESAEPGSLRQLSQLISRAALARYCNRNGELQTVLNEAKRSLTPAQMRMVTDALSLVVPLQLPRTWRKPY